MIAPIEIKVKKPIWSVIERQGSYVAQVTEANSQAKLDGWRVVATGLTVSEACEQRDSLKVSANVATPDLSDLMEWDFTEETEVRMQDDIDEFDTINACCLDGIHRTGVTIEWDATLVTIEVGNVLYKATKDTAILICKVYEDYELDAEYDEWAETLEVSQTWASVA